MDQCNWSEVLGQASVSEAGAIFREYLRGGVRTMVAQVMAAEVAERCGEKYHPSEEATNRRAGPKPEFKTCSVSLPPIFLRPLRSQVLVVLEPIAI